MPRMREFTSPSNKRDISDFVRRVPSSTSESLLFLRRYIAAAKIGSLKFTPLSRLDYCRDGGIC